MARCKTGNTENLRTLANLPTLVDRKHLTTHEVDRLIEAAKGGRNEARDRCLLLLMFPSRAARLRGMQAAGGPGRPGQPRAPCGPAEAWLVHTVYSQQSGALPALVAITAVQHAVITS